MSRRTDESDLFLWQKRNDGNKVKMMKKMVIGLSVAFLLTAVLT